MLLLMVRSEASVGAWGVCAKMSPLFSRGRAESREARHGDRVVLGEKGGRRC